MGFKQITVCRLLDPNRDLNHSGDRLFTDEFVEKLYNSEEEQRSPIILKINEVAGVQTWGIRFIENGENPGTYSAFVYLEDVSKYDVVKDIICMNTSNIVTKFYLKGNISNYLNG